MSWKDSYVQMPCHETFIFLHVIFLLLSPFSAVLSDEPRAKAVPIIFDTDITGDVDDVLALAMLHTLADRGKCEILGVTISKDHDLAAPFVGAVNTFHGHPDIPIGVGEKLPPRDSKYLALVKERDGDAFRYPHDVGISQEAEKAVPLIMRLLENADDKSVAIIQVGLATNLAPLLEAEGAMELI
jgi:inosine-uridine nucleoside N-ribohydrolase